MPHKSQDQRWANILDGLADYIETAPADEIFEEARLDGSDPEQLATRLRGLFKEALQAHRLQELARAKEGYQNELSALARQSIELPESPTIRRSWLAAVFEQEPDLVFQNRSFDELTNEDVEVHLRRLAALGLLKDIKLPDGDD